MESVLRSYAYVSQQMPLLGTTVGIIRALQANNVAPLTDLSKKSDNLSPKIFQANNIVNELFLNFNSCNLFVVAKIMAETVEHCSKVRVSTASFFYDTSANNVKLYCPDFDC
jgi:hypothetical protein